MFFGSRLSLKFRTSLILVLGFTVLFTVGVMVSIVVWVGNTAAVHNAQALFSRVADGAAERTDSVFDDPITLAKFAALDSHSREAITGNGLHHPFLAFMEGALETLPTLHSVAIGGKDGSFLQVTHVDRSLVLKSATQVPTQTRFIVIAAKSPLGYWKSYLDDRRQALKTFYVSGSVFDPEHTRWFTNALNKTGVFLSHPSQVEKEADRAMTMALALPQSQKVIGVELTLAGLQQFVDTQSVSAHGGLMVLDEEKTVLAMSKKFARRPGWLVRNLQHQIADQSIEIVVTAPASDFGAEYRTVEWAILFATLVLFAILIPLVGLFSRRLTYIMSSLSQDVDLVCRLDFSGGAPSGSKISEFDRLARGFATMKQTLANETNVLAEAQLKLKKIVETGIALSTEKNTEALNQKILDTAKELTDADGGTLYLFDESRRVLTFDIMLNDTLGTRLGGTSGNPIPPFLHSGVKLYKDDGSENHNNVASHAFLTGETINIADAYGDDRFDFSGTQAFDTQNKYRSQSFLTVPLKPMGGEVLGALQLINAKGSDGTTNVSFTPEMQSFVEALAASAATAIYNKNLLEDLERLFDSIIDIINGAIGRKSPYTGGHCDRVPIIATELAKATSAVKQGPFAGFELTALQLREFILAAKLHDVGKVTTPEYVVDKSTKLETIYNRIHEIRTRFEVLYRDAVIKRHERVLKSPKEAVKADHELAAFKAVLEDEWAFLAQTNIGGEFLSPDKVEKVKAIGQRTWLRYFDDRLGLSWEEEFRLTQLLGKDAPHPRLPIEEKLLDDKPIHVFPRTTPFAEAYKMPNGEPYPFKTPVPAVLYNHGEIYNLSIGRGTLTNEEHFKIKEHVMQSVFMLDRLPWPKGLENVPTIAGEHHETLIGSGYPFQRQAEELSMQSRILTIADIFEALTASDRPYKSPKSLSEAVKVLYFFKKDRHIDAELFDLFLTSGVYRWYAERYMRADQLDEVDITQYLGPVPA